MEALQESVWWVQLAAKAGRPATAKDVSSNVARSNRQPSSKPSQEAVGRLAGCAQASKMTRRWQSAKARRLCLTLESRIEAPLAHQPSPR